MGFAMETFPRRVEEGLPKDDPIVEVVTGATHMLMLTASGKVFTAGMKIFNVPKAITFEGDTQPVVTRIGAGKVRCGLFCDCAGWVQASLSLRARVCVELIVAITCLGRTFPLPSQKRAMHTRGAKDACKDSLSVRVRYVKPGGWPLPTRPPLAQLCLMACLGHGPQRYLSGMEKHPKRIEEFDNIGRVLDIACGGKHMLAIVEEA